MTRTPGPEPYGRLAPSLGPNDPRNRRNAQANLSPDLVYAKPLEISGKQRVSISLGDHLKLDGSGKLTVDVSSLKTALGL